MKSFNYLFLLFVVLSIAIDLIAADSDFQDSTAQSRHDNRVQNRTDRRHHRKDRRESTWTKIKNKLSKNIAAYGNKKLKNNQKLFHITVCF